MKKEGRIIVIEDDPLILEIVAYNLFSAGYDVQKITDGTEGLELLKKGGFDLAVIDIMLPGMSGLEVLDELRRISSIPVIIMSARASERDKLEGLSRMADDYITKPFSIAELVARVEVNLARYRGKIAHTNLLSVGGLVIDAENRQVQKNDRWLSLSAGEMTLLMLFAQNKGKVLSREQILNGVWGESGYIGDKRAVDVAIMRLRGKIEDDPSQPALIKSRRGAGYYLNA